MKQKMNGMTLLWSFIGFALGSTVTFFYLKKKSASSSSGGKKKILNPPIDSENTSWPFGSVESVRCFIGQLGGIWMFANDDAPSNLVMARKNFEYITTHIKYNGTDEQKAWWENFCKDIPNWDMKQFSSHSKSLIKLLLSNGFEYSDKKEIRWDENSDNFYRTFDDLEIGQKCKIAVPYWLYKGNIFEKGIVKPV